MLADAKGWNYFINKFLSQTDWWIARQCHHQRVDRPTHLDYAYSSESHCERIECIKTLKIYKLQTVRGIFRDAPSEAKAQRREEWLIRKAIL